MIAARAVGTAGGEIHHNGFVVVAQQKRQETLAVAILLTVDSWALLFHFQR